MGYTNGYFRSNTPFKPIPEGFLLSGRYLVLSFIKVGGMGAIYKVRDQRTEKILALKQMLVRFATNYERQIAIENFISEIQILRSLRHPNVPRFYDAFVQGDSFFFVMEYIKGRDLGKLIKGSYPHGAPEELVVRLIYQLLEALEYLHSLKPPVIHRDIKPQNVMLRDADQVVKLIDFGISRPKTRNYLFGTPGYSPPEQLEIGRITTASDIFALGMTAFTLLTGKAPEEDYSTDIEGELKVKGISRGLSRLIVKATSLNPDMRYQRASDMKRDLLELYPTLEDEYLWLYTSRRGYFSEDKRRIIQEEISSLVSELSYNLEITMMDPERISKLLNQELSARDYVELQFGFFVPVYLILSLDGDVIEVAIRENLLSPKKLGNVELSLPDSDFREKLRNLLKRFKEEMIKLNIS